MKKLIVIKIFKNSRNVFKKLLNKILENFKIIWIIQKKLKNYTKF